jgi:uncharacterized protein
MTATGLIVDTSVQPNFRTPAELRNYLPDTFKTRIIADPANGWYHAPGGDYASELYPSTAATGKAQAIGGGANAAHGDQEGSEPPWPGSEPEVVARHLFEDRGVDVAVLNPLTRGNHPDYLLHSQICASTNEWLVERWLTEHNSHGRFRGTIRVNPQDVPNAVSEIDKWADHPLMVQIGVPLQSLEPYGKPQFLPVWEAADHHGLPVAVHVDAGTGLDRAPTAAGHCRTHAHYASNMPLNFFIHLATLIVEGVFERLPNLKFVFQDGGSDLLTPLTYRLDLLWTSLRDQTPWVTRYPSDYLASNVRLCTSSLEGPTDSSTMDDWMGFHDRSDLVMFGSQYPHWSMLDPADAVLGLGEEQREQVMWRTANALYNLGLDEAQPDVNQRTVNP